MWSHFRPSFWCSHKFSNKQRKYSTDWGCSDTAGYLGKSSKFVSKRPLDELEQPEGWVGCPRTCKKPGHVLLQGWLERKGSRHLFRALGGRVVAVPKDVDGSHPWSAPYTPMGKTTANLPTKNAFQKGKLLVQRAHRFSFVALTTLLCVNPAECS